MIRPKLSVDHLRRHFAIWFVIEVLMKWVAPASCYPIRPRTFTASNIFDFFLAVISILSWIISSLGLRYLKAFRVLGHVVDVCMYFPWARSLQIAACALSGSLKGFISVAFFALLNYFVWSIFALHLFMGVMHTCSDTNVSWIGNCTSNSTLNISRTWQQTNLRHFDDFPSALLTMVEVSTGSWWLDVIYSAVDTTDKLGIAPKANAAYIGLFFVAYYYVAGFVILGLFSALIVYSYMRAKALLNGGAGLTYRQQLWLSVQNFLKQFKPGVQLMPLKNPVSKFLHLVCTYRWFEVIMSFVVIANIVTMSLEGYAYIARRHTLEVLQYIWVALFILESLIRVIAHGPRTFRDKNNLFDLFMVALSILQNFEETTTDHHIPFNVMSFACCVYCVSSVDSLFPEVRRLRIYSDIAFSMARCSVSCFCMPLASMPSRSQACTRLADSILVARVHQPLPRPFRWSSAYPHLIVEQGDDAAVLPAQLPARLGLRCLQLRHHWAPYFLALIFFIGIVICSLFIAVIVDRTSDPPCRELTDPLGGGIHQAGSCGIWHR